MNLKRSRNLLYLFLCVVGIMGCGYSATSALPSNLRTVFVSHFENKVDYTNEGHRQLYFPLLEVKIRDAIVNRFQFDGNLRIAKKDQAALVLEGDLLGYDREALRYDDDDDVEEYRLRVTVRLKMMDTTRDEVFWEESSFSGEYEYFLEGVNAITEEQAIVKATEDLARRIVERTIENW